MSNQIQLAKEHAHQRLEDVQQGVYAIEKSIAHTRQAIITFDKEKCWQILGYKSIMECFMTELKVGKQRVYHLLRTARQQKELEDAGAPAQTSNAALNIISQIKEPSDRVKVANTASLIAQKPDYDARHVNAAMKHVGCAVKTKEPPKTPATPPEPQIEELTKPENLPIKSNVHTAFGNKEKFQDLLTRMDTIRQLITKLSREPGGEFIPATLRDDATELRTHIAECAPHAICPICDAVATNGCNACRGAGYVPLSIFTLIPMDERIRANKRQKERKQRLGR